MTKKISTVLLIDDNPADNYIHRIELEDSGLVETIVEQTSGAGALEYLSTADAGGSFPQPELVFLDINMPAMNGWEFLQHYEKLPKDQLAKMVVVMLTTSLNPVDEKRAKSIGVLGQFMNKPLTQEAIKQVIDTNF